MSRHTIPPKSSEFDDVLVGWDRPLGHYFGEVYASRAEMSDDEDDRVILWEQFGTIDELAEAIRPYAVLTDEMRARLETDSGRASRPVKPIERPERVLFAGVSCSVVQTAYPNGAVALALFTGTGAAREPFAVPTACLPDARLAPGQALVKDYSENTGMLSALVAAGLVRPTGRTVPSGFVELHVVDVVEVAR